MRGTLRDGPNDVRAIATFPNLTDDSVLDLNIDWPEYVDQELSPECQDLIKKLLTADLTKRLGNLKVHATPNATPACALQAPPMHSPPRLGARAVGPHVWSQNAYAGSPPRTTQPSNPSDSKLTRRRARSPSGRRG